MGGWADALATAGSPARPDDDLALACRATTTTSEVATEVANQLAPSMPLSSTNSDGGLPAHQEGAEAARFSMRHKFYVADLRAVSTMRAAAADRFDNKDGAARQPLWAAMETLQGMSRRKQAERMHAQGRERKSQERCHAWYLHPAAATTRFDWTVGAVHSCPVWDRFSPWLQWEVESGGNF